jgi:hypothetical protein
MSPGRLSPLLHRIQVSETGRETVSTSGWYSVLGVDGFSDSEIGRGAYDDGYGYGGLVKRGDTNLTLRLFGERSRPAPNPELKGIRPRIAHASNRYSNIVPSGAEHLCQ